LADVIPFDGIDEGLGHAVGLRAVGGGRDRFEAELPGVEDRFERDVGAAVVGEPLDLDRGLERPFSEAVPDRTIQQKADIVPSLPGCIIIFSELVFRRSMKPSSSRMFQLSRKAMIGLTLAARLAGM
jgi:hypothetical protein